MFDGQPEVAEGVAAAGGGEGKFLDSLDGSFHRATPGEEGAETPRRRPGEEVVAEFHLGIENDRLDDRRVEVEARLRECTGTEVRRGWRRILDGVEAMLEGVAVGRLAAAAAICGKDIRR